MPLTSNFPGHPPIQAQATALKSCLQSLAWWCSSPVDFPQLLEAPADNTFITVLQNIKLAEDWIYSWSLLDQFALLVVALTAAVPIINQPHESDTTVECIENMSLLTRVFEVLTDGWKSFPHSTSDLGTVPDSPSKRS